MKRSLVGFFRALVIILGCSIFSAGVVSADLLVSPHYEFQDTDIGNGGLGISNSTNYQTNLSVGDSGIGNSSSSSYQFEAGANTTPDPALTVEVTSPTGNFGAFSPTVAATATTQFSVIDYTSYGYAVQITGNPPTNGTHTISAMPSAAVSDPGHEQFGVNLVSNTSPTSFGISPNNGQFGFGAAATNYNTTNEYRYVNGDTIADAPKSSGQTTYTISYIVNVSTLTPGGQYSSGQSIICTATY